MKTKISHIIVTLALMCWAGSAWGQGLSITATTEPRCFGDPGDPVVSFAVTNIPAGTPTLTANLFMLYMGIPIQPAVATLTIPAGSPTFNGKFDSGTFDNTSYWIIIPNPTNPSLAPLGIEGISTVSELTATISHKDMTCSSAGPPNGSITITAEGGNPDYIFGVTGDGSAEMDREIKHIDDNGLLISVVQEWTVSNGTFTVTVTDSHGCPITYINPQLTENLVTIKPLDPFDVEDIDPNRYCFENPIQIKVSGESNKDFFYRYAAGGFSFDGSGTFNIDGEATINATLTGVYGNNIQIELTLNYAPLDTPLEDGGCNPYVHTLNSITIYPPAFFTLAPQNATCPDGNGTITVNVEGGSGSFEYIISPPAEDENEEVFTVVPGTTYTFSVTDKFGSALNCPVLHKDDRMPTKTASVQRPTFSITETAKTKDPNCPGAEGEATVKVTWSVPDGQPIQPIPLSLVYSFTNTAKPENSRTFNKTTLPNERSGNTQHFFDLLEGTYAVQVEVTFAGCTRTLSGNPVTLVQPQDIVIASITPQDPAKLTQNATDVWTAICPEESVIFDVAVTGDVTRGLQYRIGASGTWQDVPTDGVFTVSTTSAGASYPISVRYSEPVVCEPPVNRTLTVTIPPPITFPTPTSAPVTCYDGNDGKIILTTPPTGGPAGTTYIYDITGEDHNGAIVSETGVADISTLSFKAGEYTITVRSVINNCKSTPADVEVIQPDELKINDPVFTKATCVGADDGAVTFTVTGGNEGICCDPSDDFSPGKCETRASRLCFFVNDITWAYPVIDGNKVTFDNLTPGNGLVGGANYEIKVFDPLGCEVILPEFTVEVAGEITISTPIVAAPASLKCHTDAGYVTITATATGDVTKGAIEFFMGKDDDGKWISYGTGTPIGTPPTYEFTFTGLGEATGLPIPYEIMAKYVVDTSNDDCSSTTTIVPITVPAPLKFEQPDPDDDVVHEICGIDGEIAITASGGYQGTGAHYRYSIDGGATWTEFENPLTHTITGLSADGLDPKEYTITVQRFDENEDPICDAISRIVTINPVPRIEFSLGAVKHLSCPDSGNEGIIPVTAQKLYIDGSEYDFESDEFILFDVEAGLPVPSTSTPHENDEFVNVPAGTYHIYVVVGGLCPNVRYSDDDGVPIPVTVIRPPAINSIVNVAPQVPALFCDDAVTKIDIDVDYSHIQELVNFDFAKFRENWTLAYRLYKENEDTSGDPWLPVPTTNQWIEITELDVSIPQSVGFGKYQVEVAYINHNDLTEQFEACDGGGGVRFFDVTIQEIVFDEDKIIVVPSAELLCANGEDRIHLNVELQGLANYYTNGYDNVFVTLRRQNSVGEYVIYSQRVRYNPTVPTGSVFSHQFNNVIAGRYRIDVEIVEYDENSELLDCGSPFMKYYETVVIPMRIIGDVETFAGTSCDTPIGGIVEVYVEGGNQNHLYIVVDRRSEFDSELWIPIGEIQGVRVDDNLTKFTFKHEELVIGSTVFGFTVEDRRTPTCGKLDRVHFTIKPYDELLASVNSIAHVTTCYGDAEGSVAINISGLTGKYNVTIEGVLYDGNSVTIEYVNFGEGIPAVDGIKVLNTSIVEAHKVDGIIVNDIINLKAGNYNVTIEDATCPEDFNDFGLANQITVNQPPQLEVNLISLDVMGCTTEDDTGNEIPSGWSLTVRTTGGTPFSPQDLNPVIDPFTGDEVIDPITGNPYPIQPYPHKYKYTLTITGVDAQNAPITTPIVITLEDLDLLEDWIDDNFIIIESNDADEIFTIRGLKGLDVGGLPLDADKHWNITISVTDANGCVSPNPVTSDDLNNPDELIFTNGGVVQVLPIVECYGDNGDFKFQFSGGTPFVDADGNEYYKMRVFYTRRGLTLPPIYDIPQPTTVPIYDGKTGIHHNAHISYQDEEGLWVTNIPKSEVGIDKPLLEYFIYREHFNQTGFEFIIKIDDIYSETGPCTSVYSEPFVLTNRLRITNYIEAVVDHVELDSPEEIAICGDNHALMRHVPAQGPNLISFWRVERVDGSTEDFTDAILIPGALPYDEYFQFQAGTYYGVIKNTVIGCEFLSDPVQVIKYIDVEVTDIVVTDAACEDEYGRLVGSVSIIVKGGREGYTDNTYTVVVKNATDDNVVQFYNDETPTFSFVKNAQNITVTKATFRLEKPEPATEYYLEVTLNNYSESGYPCELAHVWNGSVHGQLFEIGQYPNNFITEYHSDEKSAGRYGWFDIEDNIICFNSLDKAKFWVMTGTYFNAEHIEYEIIKRSDSRLPTSFETITGSGPKDKIDGGSNDNSYLLEVGKYTLKVRDKYSFCEAEFDFEIGEELPKIFISDGVYISDLSLTHPISEINGYVDFEIRVEKIPGFTLENYVTAITLEKDGVIEDILNDNPSRYEFENDVDSEGESFWIVRVYSIDPDDVSKWLTVLLKVDDANGCDPVTSKHQLIFSDLDFFITYNLPASWECADGGLPIEFIIEKGTEQEYSIEISFGGLPIFVDDDGNYLYTDDNDVPVPYAGYGNIVYNGGAPGEVEGAFEWTFIQEGTYTVTVKDSDGAQKTKELDITFPKEFASTINDEITHARSRCAVAPDNEGFISLDIPNMDVHLNNFTFNWDDESPFTPLILNPIERVAMPPATTAEFTNTYILNVWGKFIVTLDVPGAATPEIVEPENVLEQFNTYCAVQKEYEVGYVYDVSLNYDDTGYVHTMDDCQDPTEGTVGLKLTFIKRKNPEHDLFAAPEFEQRTNSVITPILDKMSVTILLNGEVYDIYDEFVPDSNPFSIDITVENNISGIHKLEIRTKFNDFDYLPDGCEFTQSSPEYEFKFPDAPLTLVNFAAVPDGWDCSDVDNDDLRNVRIEVKDGGASNYSVTVRNSSDNSTAWAYTVEQQEVPPNSGNIENVFVPAYRLFELDELNWIKDGEVYYAILEGIMEGSYDVSVTDGIKKTDGGALCDNTGTFDVHLPRLPDPNNIYANFTPEIYIFCMSDVATIDLTAGFEGFQYESQYFFDWEKDGEPLLVANTNKLEGLKAGEYSVTVSAKRDDIACSPFEQTYYFDVFNTQTITIVGDGHITDFEEMKASITFEVEIIDRDFDYVVASDPNFLDIININMFKKVEDNGSIDWDVFDDFDWDEHLDSYEIKLFDKDENQLDYISDFEVPEDFGMRRTTLFFTIPEFEAITFYDDTENIYLRVVVDIDEVLGNSCSHSEDLPISTSPIFIRILSEWQNSTDYPIQWECGDPIPHTFKLFWDSNFENEVEDFELENYYLSIKGVDDDIQYVDKVSFADIVSNDDGLDFVLSNGVFFMSLTTQKYDVEVFIKANDDPLELRRMKGEEISRIDLRREMPQIRPALIADIKEPSCKNATPTWSGLTTDSYILLLASENGRNIGYTWTSAPAGYSWSHDDPFNSQLGIGPRQENVTSGTYTVILNTDESDADGEIKIACRFVRTIAIGSVHSFDLDLFGINGHNLIIETDNFSNYVGRTGDGNMFCPDDESVIFAGSIAYTLLNTSTWEVELIEQGENLWPLLDDFRAEWRLSNDTETRVGIGSESFTSPESFDAILTNYTHHEFSPPSRYSEIELYVEFRHGSESYCWESMSLPIIELEKPVIPNLHLDYRIPGAHPDAVMTADMYPMEMINHRLNRINLNTLPELEYYEWTASNTAPLHIANNLPDFDNDAPMFPVRLETPNNPYVLTLEMWGALPDDVEWNEDFMGCPTVYSIAVSRSMDLAIPNAFAPFGTFDLNNLGVPISGTPFRTEDYAWTFPNIDWYKDHYKIEVTVMNRAGIRVFYTEDYYADGPWRGTLLGSQTPAPVGTYYYVVQLVPLATNASKPAAIQGTVTIIR